MPTGVGAGQLAKAQRSFRERMRGSGYQRLQEWIPEDAFKQLGDLCKRSVLSRREAIELLIASANEGKINLRRNKT